MTIISKTPNGPDISNTLKKQDSLNISNISNISSTANIEEKFKQKYTDPNKFGKVAVVFGGNSAERQVSLWSGAAVLSALCEQGIAAYKLDPAECDLLSTLKSENFARVFIVLHGRGGEDGVLQGALEHINLPYTGSGVMASALGMDKLKTKQIWQAQGLPVLASFEIKSVDDLDLAAQTIGFPMAVKPSKEGSSIGVSRVDKYEDLDAAWHTAGGHNSAVFAEPWIIGKGEYTAAILQDTALPLIRMETDLAFYDFDAKYLREDTRYFCPSGLNDADQSRFQDLVKKAFKALDATSWGRVDFVLDEKGAPWLLEINTVPGMTSHSLVPMAAKEAGIDFNKLCWLILEDTLK